MNTIWKVVEMTRGAVPAAEVVDLIVAEIGHQAGIAEADLGVLLRPETKNVRAGSSYPVFQAAVAQIAAGSTEDLLRGLAEIEAGSRFVESLTYEAGERLGDFLADAIRVRVAFDAGVWLALLLAARLAPVADAIVCFEAVNPAIASRAAVLGKSLRLPIAVKKQSGFFGETPAPDFDLTYLFPPLNYRMDESRPVHLALGELIGGPGRATAETVAIGEILASVPGRAVLLAGPGVAWRTAGAERQLRQDLVESGRLAAAIQLPEGVVWNGTMIGALLAICHPKGIKSHLISVADLTGQDYVRKDGRRRSLANVKLDHLLYSETSDKDRVWVSIGDAAANDYILMVSRYRPSIASGPALEAIDTFGGRPLGDLVEIIRPLAIPKDENGEYVVHEAGVRDIDGAGFLGRPQAHHRISSSGLKVAQRQRIQTDDVLLSVKGSVIGQVALVTENPPAKELWTASQSFVILRPKSGIRSNVLAAFFQDADVQAMLANLAQGVSLKTLGASDLKGIQVPQVDEETAANIDARMEQRREINAKIAELSDQLGRMAAWT